MTQGGYRLTYMAIRISYTWAGLTLGVHGAKCRLPDFHWPNRFPPLRGVEISSCVKSSPGFGVVPGFWLRLED